MTDSYIKYDETGNATSFVGPDAVELYRAAALRSALRLAKAGIQARQSLTGRQALDMATRYTGQKYKRGEYDRARQDLTVWIETMKSALPTV